MLNYNRSFDGSDMHGTMLPSTLPLGDSGHGSQPPPRVSNGSHLTATAANQQAVNEYHQVRKCRTDMYNYWK